MNTTVKFLSEKYGNYQDNYYTDNYTALLTTLLGKVLFTRQVNLGVTNGVIIENNFNGDFSNINCAIVEHDTQGTHLYKIIKKIFIKRDLWRITMVKDLVSSKYTQLLASNTLVSRLGISRTTFDPILFQKDTLDLSEVKKSNTLLNELEGAKSYGYVAIWKRGSLDGTSIVWKSTNRGASDYDYTFTTLSAYPKKDNTTSIDWYIDGSYVLKKSSQKTLMYGLRTKRGTLFANGIVTTASENYTSDTADANVLADRLKLKLLDFVMPTPLDVDDTLEDVGKVIYESSTGKYYEITRVTKRRTVNQNFTNADVQWMLGTSSFTTQQVAKMVYNEDYYEYGYNLLKTVPLLNHTMEAYANAIDQPFQVFYIPVIEGAIMSYDGNVYNSDRLVTEALLYDLISDYAGTAGKLVDVQRVPYSPVEGFRSKWNSSTNTFTVENNSLKDVIVSGDFILPVYELRYTSYSLFVNYTKTFIDYKLEQKKKYLITSPSGASVYDFSVAKNGGLDGFFVDVDIRPYSTFHRVQPNYKQIYGNPYKDTRGLIWQEDTSLTIITDAWETYKRQNMNYMSSFNTEQDYKRSALTIDQQANWGNFGFDASKRMINAAIEATTFAAEAVAQDAWFGVKGGASGAIGAAAIMGGAVVGEAIEAGQLAYNNRMDSKKLENEIDYARQQFNYNIGNIKALPENIEKVNGVFSTNNFVPYVQEFGPTDEEEAYYRNYLDLYGVNCGMLVDLSTKSFNYVQGVIVKYSSVITNEEYEELQLQLRRGVRKYEVS